MSGLAVLQSKPMVLQLDGASWSANLAILLIDPGPTDSAQFSMVSTVGARLTGSGIKTLRRGSSTGSSFSSNQSRRLTPSVPVLDSGK